MKKTLQVINKLEKEGVIERYAVGGATALLFYAEPSLTFDLDIFIFLPDSKNSKQLINLSSLYQKLKSQGYLAEKEHVLIEGIPVQFIPAYNPLVEEAVKEAVAKEYEGVPIKVLAIEYLLAIMVDTNRPKDRERIGQLKDQVKFNQKIFGAILKKYSLQDKWEKLVEKN
ncbi:MAG: hypothetical protein Q7S00_04555 [bacterium]|nr:hypothetical protein [bacterium]